MQTQAGKIIPVLTCRVLECSFKGTIVQHLDGEEIATLRDHSRRRSLLTPLQNGDIVRLFNVREHRYVGHDDSYLYIEDNGGVRIEARGMQAERLWQSFQPACATIQ